MTKEDPEDAVLYGRNGAINDAAGTEKAEMPEGEDEVEEKTAGEGEEIVVEKEEKIEREEREEKETGGQEEMEVEMEAEDEDVDVDKEEPEPEPEPESEVKEEVASAGRDDTSENISSHMADQVPENVQDRTEDSTDLDDIELPPVDYSGLSKTDLVETLALIIDNRPPSEIKDDVERIKTLFYKKLKHESEERKAKFKYYCEICDFGTFTKRFYDSHIKSQKSYQNLLCLTLKSLWSPPKAH